MDIPDAAIKLNLGIYFFASLAVSGVGLLVGTVELVYLNNRFAEKSLTGKILFKILCYAVFLFGVVLITFPIAASMEIGATLFDRRVWEKLLLSLLDRGAFKPRSLGQCGLRGKTKEVALFTLACAPRNAD